MPEIIGFFILIAILASVITGAIGTWIAGEKGLSTTKGLLYGIFLSIIGLAILGFMKSTDETIIQEMYDRDMIDLKEYEKRLKTKTEK